MIANLLIGCLAMIVCIILQTLVVALVLRYLRKRQAKRGLHASFWEACRLLTESMLILMLGNLLQEVSKSPVPSSPRRRTRTTPRLVSLRAADNSLGCVPGGGLVSADGGAVRTR